MALATNDQRDPRLEQWIVDALVFLLAPLVTVALYLPSGLLMPVRVVTMALAIIAMLQVLRRRTLPAARVTVATAGLFTVLGVFGVIGLVRYRGSASITDAVHLGFIALTTLTLSVLVRRRRTLVSLLTGWATAALLAAVVGVWEAVTANHLPGNAPARRYGHLPGWNEISSFFDNPNLYAYHLALTLLLLPLAWYLLRGWARGAVVISGVLMLYLLFATSGRMAMFTLAIGAFWWCWRSRWGRIAVVSGAVLAAVTMALKLPPGWQLYRFVYVALDGLQWEGKTTWVRAQMLKSGWWMTEQSNYLGVGPGGFATQALNPENPYRYQELNNAHWGMVEVVAEYGVVSLLALLAALCLALVFVFRTLHATRDEFTAFDRAVAHAAGILTLTLPVICLSHSTWLRQPLTAVHLGTLVALLAWTELRSRPKTEAA